MRNDETIIPNYKIEDVKCPYCGASLSNGPDYLECEKDFEKMVLKCDTCSRDFVVWRDTIQIFETRKISDGILLRIQREGRTLHIVYHPDLKNHPDNLYFDTIKQAVKHATEQTKLFLEHENGIR
jgi:DNA-directed RNA polymerase subunit RPC12/RpoP